MAGICAGLAWASWATGRPQSQALHPWDIHQLVAPEIHEKCIALCIFLNGTQSTCTTGLGDGRAPPGTPASPPMLTGNPRGMPTERLWG